MKQEKKRVLLSIKPEFSERIFDGTKLFEYRKCLFKRDDIETIVVYASSPICRVIGEFTISGILSDTPSNLWEQTSDGAGIDQDFFKDYFKNRAIGHAIQIGKIKKYRKAKFLSDFLVNQAPQSFVYID